MNRYQAELAYWDEQGVGLEYVEVEAPSFVTAVYQMEARASMLGGQLTAVQVVELFGVSNTEQSLMSETGRA